MNQHSPVRLFVAIVLAGWITAGSAWAQTTVTSTEQDQKELAVTVYNSNVALVRDVRRVHLPGGVIDLRYMDIAAQVNPATVHIVSLTAPKELNVLEQNYEYDLLSPQKLLQKYVGKELTLVRVIQENNSTREVPVKALLLSDNDGPVWKVGNEIITGMGADRYVFPDMPENLYSKPTLVWLLDNRHTGEQAVEASYLTNQMNWNSDYVLTVHSDQKSADLNGWVTVVNQSGTSFRNAQLQLVAGELNRVMPSGGMVMREMLMKSANAPAPQFQQEALSEYHLYTLQRPTSIQNNESKQISLLAAAGAAVEKVFEVDGQSYYYQSPQSPGQPAKEPVKVLIKFKNTEANSLGVPLPAGTVRVYQGDSKGRVQFIGEDRIDHTPKDETVSLYIGNAFDVVAERKQTDYQRLGSHSAEVEYEVSLRNHKPEPVTVFVNEPISGDWTMLNSTFKFEKTAAFAARFTVPVAANSEALLKYRVRIHW
ncbi:MAG: DUF4139 domain-containing protein [Acidobacteriota bacterium]|nr:DUF4139 domain-containing protein [Acidobacteriota bacterium]